MSRTLRSRLFSRHDEKAANKKSSRFFASNPVLEEISTDDDLAQSWSGTEDIGRFDGDSDLGGLQASEWDDDYQQRYNSARVVHHHYRRSNENNVALRKNRGKRWAKNYHSLTDFDRYVPRQVGELSANDINDQFTRLRHSDEPPIDIPAAFRGLSFNDLRTRPPPPTPPEKEKSVLKAGQFTMKTRERLEREQRLKEKRLKQKKFQEKKDQRNRSSAAYEDDEDVYASPDQIFRLEHKHMFSLWQDINPQTVKSNPLMERHSSGSEISENENTLLSDLNSQERYSKVTENVTLHKVYGGEDFRRQLENDEHRQRNIEINADNFWKRFKAHHDRERPLFEQGSAPIPPPRRHQNRYSQSHSNPTVRDFDYSLSVSGSTDHEAEQILNEGLTNTPVDAQTSADKFSRLLSWAKISRDYTKQLEAVSDLKTRRHQKRLFRKSEEM